MLIQIKFNNISHRVYNKGCKPNSSSSNSIIISLCRNNSSNRIIILVTIILFQTIKCKIIIQPRKINKFIYKSK